MTQAQLLHAVIDQLDDATVEALAARLAPHLAVRLAELDNDGQSSTPVAYTVATLAGELGVSERTIRNAIERKELPARKRGRRWIIAVDAARAWSSPDGSRAPRRRAASPARRRAHAQDTLAAAVSKMGLDE